MQYEKKNKTQQTTIYILSFYIIILSAFLGYETYSLGNAFKENNEILKTLTHQHDQNLVEELQKQLEKQVEKNNQKNFSDKKANNINSSRQINCLAENMYHEARGESTEGIMAVGFVTMNRVNSGQFANSVCGVVNQKNVVNKDDEEKVVCQFSWKCDDNLYAINDKEKWKEIKSLAARIYKNHSNMKDNTNGALYFHNLTVTPKFSNIIKTAQIENHIFYKKKS